MIGKVYTKGKVFVYVYKRLTKGDAGTALGLLYEMFGKPVKLIYNRSAEKVGSNS